MLAEIACSLCSHAEHSATKRRNALWFTWLRHGEARAFGAAARLSAAPLRDYFPNEMQLRACGLGYNPAQLPAAPLGFLGGGII